MDISHVLKHVGLSSHEARIYKSLLESGPSTVAAIARACDMHRPVVYKHLPELQKKGLVSAMIKGKTTYYVAQSPDRLTVLYGQTMIEVKEAIEELKKLATKDGKPIVTFLEGKEAIRGIFYDMITTLPRGGIFYRYTSSVNEAQAESYLPKEYHEIRDKKQLERFVISNVKRAKGKKASMERNVRVVPPNFDWFEDNVTLLMYTDKIAYIDYNSETATLIENRFVASFQVKLFRLLFRCLDDRGV